MSYRRRRCRSRFAADHRDHHGRGTSGGSTQPGITVVRPAIVNGPSRTAVPIVTVNQFPGYHCTARRTLQVKPSRGSSGRSRAVGAADPIAVQGFGARNRLGATTTYGLPIVDRSIRGAVDATGGLAIDADRRLSARSHEIGFMPTSHRPRRHHLLRARGSRPAEATWTVDVKRVLLSIGIVLPGW